MSSFVLSVMETFPWGKHWLRLQVFQILKVANILGGAIIFMINIFRESELVVGQKNSEGQNLRGFKIYMGENLQRITILRGSTLWGFKMFRGLKLSEGGHISFSDNGNGSCYKWCNYDYYYNVYKG